jgi:hypothetical protein
VGVCSRLDLRPESALEDRVAESTSANIGEGAYYLNTIESSLGIAGVGPLILFVDRMSETRPSKMCLESRDSQGNRGSLDQSIGDLQ